MRGRSCSLGKGVRVTSGREGEGRTWRGRFGSGIRFVVSCRLILQCIGAERGILTARDSVSCRIITTTSSRLTQEAVPQRPSHQAERFQTLRGSHIHTPDIYDFASAQLDPKTWGRLTRIQPQDDCPDPPRAAPPLLPPALLRLSAAVEE